MTATCPLQWPVGRPRAKGRQESKFRVSHEKAFELLRWEVERLGGRNIAVTTDAKPMPRAMRPVESPKPADPGVAVHFTLNGRTMCFACDRWTALKDNALAIAKTIEALRGIARWGSGDMLEAAFSGFVALPASKRHWREVLGFKKDQPVTRADIVIAFRRLATERHPDAGGNDADMAAINVARDEALAEKGA